MPQLKKIIQTLILKTLVISLLIGLSLFSVAQVSTARIKRPKIALVLSGGGAKGFAHIGVLKVLEEEGIPVDMIVGTSIGSLIGGIYSLGYNAAYIENLVKHQEWERLLSDEVPRPFLSRNDKLLKQRYILPLSIKDKSIKSLPKGLINNQNILNLFCGLAGNVPENADFSKFPIQFACVATDLETGDEMVMKNGFLPSAMYASMAIPGIFQPAEYNGHVLVDGGIANNFPVDVAKGMGADIIIGVDIRGTIFNRDQLKSAGEVFGNLINFYSKGKDSANLRLCNLIVRPDVAPYTLGSFTTQAADTLILRGEKAARSMIDQIRELKQAYHLESQRPLKDLSMPGKWRVTEIRFPGNDHLDKDYLKNKLSLDLPGDHSYEEIKNSIDRLYGTGGFSKIYFWLEDNNTGKTLVLNLAPKKENSLHLGFSANTYDAASLMLNATRINQDSWLRLFSVSTELSANPELSILAETRKTHLPTFGLEAKWKYLNYNIYENGQRYYDADLFYSSATLYLSQALPKMSEIGLGLQEEYFNGDVFTKKTDESFSSSETNDWLTNAYTYFYFDNTDNFYFPNHGTSLYVEFSTCADLKNVSSIHPALLVKVRNVWPVGGKTSVLFDFYSRILFNSQYPLVKTTVVGGEGYSTYFNYHFPFMGLPPVIFVNQDVFIGSLGLRFKLQENQYLSCILNSLYQNVSSNSMNFRKAVLGGGIKYSLKTLIGPAEVGLGYSDLHNRLTISANIGYWF